jgi:RNA polymerase sigma factor (sigma-70 family)
VCRSHSLFAIVRNTFATSASSMRARLENPLSDYGSITRWITDLRAGKHTAAAELWERYYERLVRLAAENLRGSPKQVADEEDVVVDAFDSFCRGVRAGRFPKLEDRDDLWQVLVMLAARKAINQAKHYQRLKRGGPISPQTGGPLNAKDMADLDQIVGSEPTPEFAAQVSEECRRLLNVLANESLRAVAVAKMEGYSNAEIGQKLGLLQRSVERKLQLIRELWSKAAL